MRGRGKKEDQRELELSTKIDRTARTSRANHYPFLPHDPPKERKKSCQKIQNPLKDSGQNMIWIKRRASL